MFFTQKQINLFSETSNMSKVNTLLKKLKMSSVFEVNLFGAKFKLFYVFYYVYLNCLDLSTFYRKVCKQMVVLPYDEPKIE